MDCEVCTLCLLVKDGRVLLGMKKVGFGVGKYNGFGGKVDAGETVDEAALREMTEESGVLAEKMEKMGILSFYWPDRVPPRTIEVHVYRIDAYGGVVQETSEMRPEWFAIADIPYDQMWPDDRFWLPLLLEGKKFKGTFHFGQKDDMIFQELAVVPVL